MPHQIDWNAIAAYIAAIAAFMALIISIYREIVERNRFRLSQSVSLLLKFEDRFDSEAFRKKRIQAARQSLQGDLGALDPILGFFETIGLLLQRGALDQEMIWSSFYYWITSYTQAANSYISDVQNKDPTVWSYVRKLHDCVNAVQEKNTHRGYLPMTDDEKNAFLKDEANLSQDMHQVWINQLP